MVMVIDTGDIASPPLTELSDNKQPEMPPDEDNDEGENKEKDEGENKDDQRELPVSRCWKQGKAICQTMSSRQHYWTMMKMRTF